MHDIDDIQRTLGRLEAKVDLLLVRGERDDVRHDALAQRMSLMEHAASFQKGVVAVIATVAGAVSAAASKFFGVT